MIDPGLTFTNQVCNVWLEPRVFPSTVSYVAVHLPSQHSMTRKFCTFLAGAYAAAPVKFRYPPSTLAGLAPSLDITAGKPWPAADGTLLASVVSCLEVRFVMDITGGVIV